MESGRFGTDEVTVCLLYRLPSLAGSPIFLSPTPRLVSLAFSPHSYSRAYISLASSLPRIYPPVSLPTTTSIHSLWSSYDGIVWLLALLSQIMFSPFLDLTSISIVSRLPCVSSSAHLPVTHAAGDDTHRLFVSCITVSSSSSTTLLADSFCILAASFTLPYTYLTSHSTSTSISYHHHLLVCHHHTPRRSSFPSPPASLSICFLLICPSSPRSFLSASCV